jgi:hypothetical protein
LTGICTFAGLRLGVVFEEWIGAARFIGFAGRAFFADLAFKAGLAGIDAAFRATGFFTAGVLRGFLGACARFAADFFAAVVLAVTDGFFFAASFFILLLVRGG